jgi:dUTP pyrophosphatase
MNSFDVNITKVRENAIIPTKATSGSAGFDLHACIDKDLTIKKGDLIRIPCGVAIELPSSEYAAFIFARSGLGIKYGISLSNGVGVIDSDYRGEIQVGLCRTSDGDPYVIKNGDRIAQMIIIPVSNVNFKLVENLGESERGSGGFGSTGR